MAILDQQHYFIVVKKHKDGYHYVPFDDDPNSHEHRLVMIGHLMKQGHVVERVTDDPVLGDHVILHSGPMSARG